MSLLSTIKNTANKVKSAVTSYASGVKQRATAPVTSSNFGSPFNLPQPKLTPKPVATISQSKNVPNMSVNKPVVTTTAPKQSFNVPAKQTIAPPVSSKSASKSSSFANPFNLPQPKVVSNIKEALGKTNLAKIPTNRALGINPLQLLSTPEVQAQGSQFGDNGIPTGQQGGVDFATPEAQQAFQQTGVTPTGQMPTTGTADSMATSGATTAQGGMASGQAAKTAEKYKQTFQQVSQSGQPAPTELGGGSAAVQENIPQNQEPPAGGTNIVNDLDSGEDKDWLKLEKMYEDHFNPENQAKSLTETYQSLMDSSGIQALDTQLMNMSNVINGTEGDIRTEVEKVGGFASDSQVMAMTSARNKTLIQNYNNLLQTRENQMNYINTMMNFAKDDRDYANKQFAERMDFEGMKIQMKDKALNAAKEGYNNLIKNVGYKGLLEATNGNPSSIAKIESALGLAKGGLTKLANYVPPQSEEEKLNLEYKRAQIANMNDPLDRQIKQAQLSNIYSTIANRDNKAASLGVNPKVLSTPQFKAAQSAQNLKLTLQKAVEAVNKYGNFEKVNATGKGLLDTLKVQLRSEISTALEQGVVVPGEAAAFDEIAGQLNKSRFIRNSKTLASLNSLLSSMDGRINTQGAALEGTYGVDRATLNQLLHIGNFVVSPEGEEIEIVD